MKNDKTLSATYIKHLLPSELIKEIGGMRVAVKTVNIMLHKKMIRFD